jgi:hypothetical protein
VQKTLRVCSIQVLYLQALKFHTGGFGLTFSTALGYNNRIEKGIFGGVLEVWQ